MKFVLAFLISLIIAIILRTIKVDEFFSGYFTCWSFFITVYFYDGIKENKRTF